MGKSIKINLVTDSTKAKKLVTKKNVDTNLPRIYIEGKTFLGWNVYQKLNYGYMNVNTDEDTTLYAISTSGPCYVIESHFRSVPEDYKGERAHFRRYVLDIYLENAEADSGSFKLENCNNIFYYLGNVPVDGIDATVDANTNFRGDAYRDVGYFTTTDITVNWNSQKPVDATCERRKIATIMLAFSRWGMSYNEVERRTSDEIIIPAYDYKATAGEKEAAVSANFYNGQAPEVLVSGHDAISVRSEDELPHVEMGSLLSRFAVLADTHVGVRYNWENYEWLYGVFKHLKEIHEEKALDFVLQLGDNIDDGYAPSYETDYKIYLDMIKDLEICDGINPIEGRAEGKIPHYEIQGNHDTSFDTRFFRTKLWYTENESGQKVAYIAFFTDYGGYPAVNFNVAGNYLSYKSYGVLTDEMVDFVKDSIEEAKKNNAVHIVLLNHFGIAQDLGAPVLPETGFGKIENLCKKYDIRLYLNGHEHNGDYTLRKYNRLYDYDAAMTHDKYAVFEIWEKCAKVKIYNTEDNSLDRIDIVNLK